MVRCAVHPSRRRTRDRSWCSGCDDHELGSRWLQPVHSTRDQGCRTRSLAVVGSRTSPQGRHSRHLQRGRCHQLRHARAGASASCVRRRSDSRQRARCSLGQEWGRAGDTRWFDQAAHARRSRDRRRRRTNISGRRDGRCPLGGRGQHRERHHGGGQLGPRHRHVHVAPARSPVGGLEALRTRRGRQSCPARG